MRFAVAIASPPNFQHSRAFDEVAEGLHLSLLALGHDSMLTDRLDLDDRRTIVLGGNLLVRNRLTPPKNAIFYNLEQLGDDLPSMTLPGFSDLFRLYPTWDYSQANIDRLAAMGLPRPTHVPIGYVPELTRIAPAAEDVDVLFYGATYERRYAILRDLHDRGLRVKWLSGSYGAGRDAWIARSKVVINIHYWDAKLFEITRVSYLLANKRAVVSETGADPTLEFGLETGVAFADYDELVDRCVSLVGDERARRELAERGFEAFSARRQTDILSGALDELEDVADHSVAGVEFLTDVRRDDDDEESRRRRELQLFKHKFEPDRDRWLANVARNPDDSRSVFFLAETYFQLEEFADARTWYARRAEMGGCDEEVYWALFRLAASMSKLSQPWPEVQDAYLKAWEFRPTRAEALYSIAFWYRHERRYRLGYMFAQRAAGIPLPEDDLYVLGYFAEIYSWRAIDEQATCAFWIGRRAEAFTLCRRLLARRDLPDSDRQRIAINRDFSVSAMIEAAAPYPEALAQTLTTGVGRAGVTVTLIAGPDRHTTEQTLNSFVNCCLDVSRVGRFLVLDTGLTAADKSRLQQSYPFLEFTRSAPSDQPAAQLAQLHAKVTGRLWLHLGRGWRFFAPEKYITRLTAILDREEQAFQVGINFSDAATLTRSCAVENAVRRAPAAGRYLMTQAMARGPAMFDTARLDRAVGVEGRNPYSLPRRGRPGANSGLRTACLDEVFCFSDLSAPDPVAP